MAKADRLYVWCGSSRSLLRAEKTTPIVCQGNGITEQTYYRWRKESGGLQVDQARRLKELEHENAKLKRLVYELSFGETGVEGHRLGKLLSSDRQRCAVDHAKNRA